MYPSSNTSGLSAHMLMKRRPSVRKCTRCDEAGRKDDVLRGIEKRALTSDD